MKVVYVKHPITAEQKEMVRKETGGARIVDARFAPEGCEIIDLNDDGATSDVQEPKKRGRKKKADK